jgi:hypothetical protein
MGKTAMAKCKMDVCLALSLLVDKRWRMQYISAGGIMLTRTLKVTDRFIEIPGLEKYRGKMVEVTVKEKYRVKDKKRKLKKFFALCGKVDLDQGELTNLREQSLI